MFYSMTHAELIVLLENLAYSDEFHVLAPVPKDDHFEFLPITTDYEDDEAITAQDFRSDYPISNVSPLKTFLTPVCNVLKKLVTDANGDPDWLPADSLKEKKPVIFFGVHPYDIQAMNIVDNEFARGNHADPYYVERRKRMIVIGLDVINPPPHSFAHDMGAHTVKKGFDIMLTYNTSENYIVETKSAIGQQLVCNYSEAIYRPYTPLRAIRWLWRFMTSFDYPESLPMKATKIKAFLIANKDNQHLAHSGESCFECKKCIDVCPTCTCYETEEIPSLDGATGETITNSACCLNENFSRMAEDVISRFEIGARILNRLVCKRGDVEVLGCTGCGRCDAICPTDIASIPDNLRALKEGGAQ